MLASEIKAVGAHVFAGGFTMGLRKVIPVVGQLEIHDFGRETVEQRLKIPFMNSSEWKGWYDYKSVWENCNVCYGNPRCTGFSCITAGYNSDAHGAWSAPTKDIHDLCEFGVAGKFPIICWESVQQAFSVGRPLLDHLRDNVFTKAGYRIAHLFINAATFGNSQQRKRYFFVAYPADHAFNIEPPPVNDIQTSVWDVIGGMESRKTTPFKFRKSDGDYTPDCYHELNADNQRCLPLLDPGWSLHDVARSRPDELKKASERFWNKWDDRMSEMPFSMHCIQRLRKDGVCPTISSSAKNNIHPTLDRPITIRECAKMMDWGNVTPLGDNPIPQIAKGIVPAVGEWLAQQIVHCLTGYWGKDDYESEYDVAGQQWVGHDSTGQVEKTFNMTQYAPRKPRYEYV